MDVAASTREGGEVLLVRASLLQNGSSGTAKQYCWIDAAQSASSSAVPVALTHEDSTHGEPAAYRRHGHQHSRRRGCGDTAEVDAQGRLLR